MPASRPDTPTVIAVAVLAYILAKVVHEILGHGLTCYLTGADWQGFSLVWNRCNYEQVGPWALRGTKAAGTVANLLAGKSALLFSVTLASRAPVARYFLWLLGGVNLLMAAGYLAVDPLFGFGDWTAFLEGLSSAGILRWVLVAAGVGAYAAVVWVLLRTAKPLLGAYPDASPRSTAWRLCLVPYLVVGGCVMTGLALLNSEGPGYAITSALATLGGTSALAWMPTCLPAKVRPAEGLVIPRSIPWMVAGGVVLLLGAVVLGPGVSLH